MLSVTVFIIWQIKVFCAYVCVDNWFSADVLHKLPIHTYLFLGKRINKNRFYRYITTLNGCERWGYINIHVIRNWSVSLIFGLTQVNSFLSISNIFQLWTSTQVEKIRSFSFAFAFEHKKSRFSFTFWTVLNGDWKENSIEFSNNT